MIQLVWLTIGFQIFNAFTLAYKLFIPSSYRVLAFKSLSKMSQEKAAVAVIIALISENNKSPEKRKKKSLCETLV